MARSDKKAKFNCIRGNEINARSSLDLIAYRLPCINRLDQRETFPLHSRARTIRTPIRTPIRTIRSIRTTRTLATRARRAPLYHCARWLSMKSAPPTC